MTFLLIKCKFSQKGIDKKMKMCGESNRIYTSDRRGLSCRNKNKLNMLISKMEKNVSDFVVNPKKDFIRRSELSFSKTMKFILGMGSRTLGKELLDF